MCGIAGTLYFNKKKSTKYDIYPMLRALDHRGPDDQGVYIDDHVVLGNTRLSICDISNNGHMPMSNEDKTVWITFNGEIYNYKSLYSKLKHKHVIISKSDTELILHLYEEYGTKIVEMIEGMFAFAIWDKKKQQLFLARDLLGKKPLKYFLNESFFCFASELKAIVNNKLIPRDLDYQAIDQYLTYQYVPSPKTGFKGIYKLPPGHWMTINIHKQKKVVEYWDLQYKPNDSITETEWENRLNSSLIAAVQQRIPSEVSYGVHLSGGLDSSLITAILAHEAKKLKTFSVAFKDSKQEDNIYSVKVSKLFSTKHYELNLDPRVITSLPEIVRSFEEPFADSSAVATWHLSKYTREQGISVVFNGDGGDEMFAGYERHLYAMYYKYFKYISYLKPLKKILTEIPHPFFHRISKAAEIDSVQSLYLESANIFNPQEKEAVYSPMMKKFLRTEDSFFNSHFKKTKSYDNLHKILYMDVRTYLSECLLMKTDIGGMSHALEIRSPFLDENIIALSSSLPSKYKIKGFEQKYLLKKIAEKYLPKDIIYRQKNGFGLPNEWLKYEWRNFAYENLLDEQFLSYGLFSKNGIENLLDNFYKKNHNVGNHIWSLITLKEWLAQWFQ